MKKNKIIFSLCAIVLMTIGNGCTDLLTEKPQSNVVPTVFSTPAGLLGGISGVYNDIRAAWGTEGFTVNYLAGTDEYLAGGSAAVGQSHHFTYNGLTSADEGGFSFYSSINALNGILLLGPDTKGLDAATLKAYLGQAQFLRAFLYFNLVQTYGNIPLHAEFITVPSQADAPAAAADIYKLIVQDLTNAIANLPNQPTAPFLGKAATVASAKWLLAKVYLTRGWLTDSQADFQLAYTTAQDLITNKATYGLDLWADYADAFKPANDYGKETLFVSDHSTDTKYGAYQVGAAGGNGVNVAPWMHLFNGPSVLGVNSTFNATTKAFSPPGTSSLSMLVRDVQFGRPFTRIRPNMPPLTSGPNNGKSYLLDQAFADRINDSRYSKTFQTVWLTNAPPGGGGGQAITGTYSGAGVTGSRGTLTAGIDTAVWFADRPITGAPQAVGSRPFKGIVVSPSMQNNTIYPYMKKQADPSRASQNDPSARPFIIARFAEVYLIAAEAAFKAGNSQNAADALNVLRKRAAKRSGVPYSGGGAFGSATPTSQIVGDPYPTGVTQATAETAMTITNGTVTLDFILDEWTRELYGESQRWLDLVRTKSLLTRVKAWNPVEAGANIQDFHILRPIPQDEINFVSVGPKYPQNKGY